MRADVIMFPSTKAEELEKLAVSMVRLARMSLRDFPESVLKKELNLVVRRTQLCRLVSQSAVKRAVEDCIVGEVLSRFDTVSCRNCHRYATCEELSTETGSDKPFRFEHHADRDCAQYQPDVRRYEGALSEYSQILAALNELLGLKIDTVSVGWKILGIVGLWHQTVFRSML